MKAAGEGLPVPSCETGKKKWRETPDRQYAAARSSDEVHRFHAAARSSDEVHRYHADAKETKWLFVRLYF